MKSFSSLRLLVASAVLSLATAAIHADDDSKQTTKTTESGISLSPEAIEAMMKSGLDPEILEQVKKAMENGDTISVSSAVIGKDEKAIKLDRQESGKVSVKKESSPGENGEISVTTTVVGPDGKVIKRSGGKSVTFGVSDQDKKTLTFDLGKLISEATAAAGATADAGSSANSSGPAAISGKVMIVGKDGEIQTHSISEGLESEALEKALGEAFGAIDIEMLQRNISPLGMTNQAQVFGFGQPVIEDGSVSDRLSDIEKELKEQRDLLEKILKKL